MRAMLNSKIHKATVTEADLDYIGSIAIPKQLLVRFLGIDSFDKINASARGDDNV